ncbi:hypothetical protein MAPG_11157 [Magnaporthiopsis poae ATCC 64411]|uniref:Heterokaryon incompatibility domain-containing protein n=1 Tax=Magnaporthiopsis poae (strain ATCC 64411 / 73-15) TaxID=644358 RepID=A0A0C4EEI4_MAGP6|nr:hypothetical protein MAPG_11157 [Magnaporthiopsis poae ATCC 64411]
MHPVSAPPVGGSSACIQDQQIRYYQYEPIPKGTQGGAGRATGTRQTRLLELRRKDDGTVEYSLSVHNLADVDAQYDAISYCWGDPTMDHTITVDGALLRVTAAVVAMLQKDQQIPLMRTIYRGARKVVAYLGDAPDAALAADFVPKLAIALAKQATVLRARGGFRDTDGHLDGFEPAALPGQVDDWRALLNLLVDPYWSRTWIIQETVLAREIELLYGGRGLDWDEFGVICAALRGPKGGLVCVFLGSTPGLVELYMPAMQGLGQIFGIDTQRKRLFRIHDDNTKMLLPYLIAECCQSKATCPEDKVIGLLGLGRGGIDDDDWSELGRDTRELLLPDHARSVLEVYGDAVEFSLRQNCFALLNIAGCYYKRSSLDLPSWIPDLSAPPEIYPLDSVASKYKAGSPYTANFLIRLDRRRLRIYGWLFDEVAAVGSAPAPTSGGLAHEAPQMPLESLEFWRRLSGQHREAWRLVEQHLPRGRHPITGEACWRALCRTVVGDELPDSERLDTNLFDKVLDAYNAFAFFGACMDWRDKTLAKGLDPDTMDLPPVPELGLPDMMLESEADWLNETLFALRMLPGYEQTIPAKVRFLYRMMARKMMLRSFAITKEGHMMLVPPGTKKGDAVCIFAGAKTPYILRRDECHPPRDAGEMAVWEYGDEEDEIWQLYGEAYVHCMMDAQILGKRIYQRWFELR